jgi:hypothetical protein
MKPFRRPQKKEKIWYQVNPVLTPNQHHDVKELITYSLVAQQRLFTE